MKDVNVHWLGYISVKGSNVVVVEPIDDLDAIVLPARYKERILKDRDAKWSFILEIKKFGF